MAGALLLTGFGTGCNDFLDEDADNVFTQHQIFSDNALIESAIANLYGRVEWGQSFSNITEYTVLDEAAYGWGGPSETAQFFQNHWRMYDYGLMREMNLFLEGLQSEAADSNRQLTDDMKRHYEGEVRFLRAWLYFNMCERLGGLPLIGDKVYEYEGQSEIPKMYVARATEEETYDYIISECNAVADYFLNDVVDPMSNIHAARATKWAALALKARAAIYAGSIARYNIVNNCLIKTSGLEVGIPEEQAAKFYKIAYEAAKEIIKGGKYSLYRQNSDKALNFYDLFVKKDSNPEVIWALDYIYPGKTHTWTSYNFATSVKTGDYANTVLPVLNLVEDFEYVNDRNGALKLRNGGDYVYYDNPEDLFKDKDPRLWHGHLPGSLVPVDAHRLSGGYYGQELRSVPDRHRHPRTNQCAVRRHRHCHQRPRGQQRPLYEQNGLQCPQICLREHGPGDARQRCVVHSLPLRRGADDRFGGSTRTGLHGRSPRLHQSGARPGRYQQARDNDHRGHSA